MSPDEIRAWSDEDSDRFMEWCAENGGHDADGKPCGLIELPEPTGETDGANPAADLNAMRKAMAFG